MFTRDQDFVCEERYGIVRCLPKSVEATSAFKVLQLQLSKVLPQLPDAPPITIEVDGIIGPTVALGVQAIAARLAQGRHPELAQLAIAQPEEAIPAIASRALEITGYVESVLAGDPTAVITPKPPVEEDVDPLSMLRAVFTPKRIGAGVGVILGVGALIWAGAAARRRGLGMVDRSSLLPPSDGSDDFEEIDEETDASDGINREGAIDVQSVEVSTAA